MKTPFKTLTLLLLLAGLSLSSQTMKEYKAGHVFTVSLPDYMSKTIGLNASASLQFKNTAKDVAGVIIEDSKEDLGLAAMTYNSATEFFEFNYKDFLKDEQQRKISEAKTKKTGTTNFVEAEASYYDPESQMTLYYFIGIVETPTYYYQVLCWCDAANKDKFKADFQKIVYSIKD